MCPQVFYFIVVQLLLFDFFFDKFILLITIEFICIHSFLLLLFFLPTPHVWCLTFCCSKQFFGYIVDIWIFISEIFRFVVQVFLRHLFAPIGIDCRSSSSFSSIDLCGTISITFLLNQISSLFFFKQINLVFLNHVKWISLRFLVFIII